MNLAGAGTQNAGLAFSSYSVEEYNGSSWATGNSMPPSYCVICHGGAGTQSSALAFGGYGYPTNCTTVATYTQNSSIKTFDHSATTGKTTIIPPTSNPGIAGALWNNNGTLSISAG